MPFSYTVTLNDPKHLQQDAALLADVQKAAADWSQYLGGLGSIQIEVDVIDGTTRANATPGDPTQQVGTDGIRTVYEGGSLYELLTGIDPNGSAPDIIVRVDQNYLQTQLWLDPNPSKPSAIPATLIDGISTFRHELGHGFGIYGFRSQTGQLSTAESTWDKLVQIQSDGSAWFTGANAEAVYGGPVPITIRTDTGGEQYFHLGNGSDAASSDLMNGVTAPVGKSVQVSALDVAIMRDLADSNNSAQLTPTLIGQVGDVGIYRIDLSSSGISSIQSITIHDDNIVSGGTGGASGFDLDFLELSNTSTFSASTAVSLIPGLNDFDFSSAGVTFHPGFLQAWQSGNPDFWNTSQLFGTTGANLQYSQAGATLNALDGSNANSNGAISLGEGGYVTFHLKQPISTSNLYLYFGDVGGGNDTSYVVVGAGPTQATAPGATLAGTPGDDDLRLGIGLNANLGSGDDIIKGGSGNDQIAGAAGSDLLTGGPGNDTIDGGPGIDSAFFSGLRSAYTLTAFSSTGIHVVGPDGTDTLTNVERLVFDDLTVSFGLHTPFTDFDANTRSDILWHNDNGADSIWDNGAIGGAHIIAASGVVPASWHIADKGDFDGNGHSDILWRNDDGSVSIWDNGAIGGAHIVSGPGVVSNSWHISGTGDFDDNNQDDILWRNDDGSTSIWDNGDINKAHIISGPGVVPAGWHISGTGDFDGNGQSDILWRNDNGAASIWDNGNINQAHIIAGAGVIPAGWSIAGTGDFDGNNQTDILWQRNDGTVAIWDNGQIGGAHWIADPGVVPAGWHIAGTGDFDGNGHSDILWRNDNGAASIWDNGDINHAHIIADAGVIPAGWHIV